MRVLLRWVAVYDQISDVWYPELYHGDVCVGVIDGFGFKDERECALFIYDNFPSVTVRAPHLERRV